MRACAFVCVCLCVCVHACVHACVHMCVCTHVRVHVYVCVHACPIFQDARVIVSLWACLVLLYQFFYFFNASILCMAVDQ